MTPHHLVSLISWSALLMKLIILQHTLQRTLQYTLQHIRYNTRFWYRSVYRSSWYPFIFHFIRILMMNTTHAFILHFTHILMMNPTHTFISLFWWSIWRAISILLIHIHSTLDAHSDDGYDSDDQYHFSCTFWWSIRFTHSGDQYDWHIHITLHTHSDG